MKLVTRSNNLARRENFRCRCRMAIRDSRHLAEKLVETGAAEPTLQSELE